MRMGYSSSVSIVPGLILSILSLFAPLKGQAEKNPRNPYNFGGISFQSHDFPVEERTGLELSPKQGFNVDSRVLLEFDLSFYRNDIMGYIFRMHSSKKSYDLIFLPRVRGEHSASIQLIADGSETHLKFNLPDYSLLRNNWNTLRLVFDKKSEWISMELNGQIKREEGLFYPDADKINICFGKNTNERFKALDVPGMVVRNIKISTPDKKIDAFWPLIERKGDTAEDIISHRTAQACYPKWLIESHYQWQLRTTRKDADYLPGIAFSSGLSNVFVVNRNKLLRFDLLRLKWTTDAYPQDLGINEKAIYSYYAPQRKQLLAYDYRMGPVAEYNPKTLSWSKINALTGMTSHWHHLQFYDSASDRLYALGGYGMYRFNNTLLSFQLGEKNWKKFPLKGDLMEPRSLSSLTHYKDQKYLVFGGIGNQTGRQELGVENFYDLYVLDLSDSTMRRLWSRPELADNFVAAHSLILSEDKQSLYALCYKYQKQNSALSLLKIDIQTGENKVISDSIPYPFKDVRSSADLFFHTKTSEFVAVVRDNVEKNNSEVKIYTLTYPAVPLPPVLQAGTNTKKLWWPYVVLLLTGGALIFIKKRKQTNISKELITLPSTAKKDSGTNFQEKKDTPDDMSDSSAINPVPPAPSEVFAQKKLPEKNYIRLFGKFEVVNRNGEDISKNFTPKIRQLFLLILLYPYTHRRGINSNRLTSIIWPGSTTQEAKNTRSISIRRLRLLLKELDFANIQFEDNQWHVEFSGEIYCDFKEFLDIRSSLDKSPNELAPIRKLVGIAQRGQLALIENEWFDDLKEFVSSDIIRILDGFVEQLNVQQYAHEVIEIGDAIFNLDPLEDTALRIKMQALLSLNKHSTAHALYNKFAQKYYKLFDENYPMTFQEMIRNKIDTPE
ncbi:MAG: hypothetical protein MI784_05965 [Cytophagales bacterium]|nr:hypothetical protein [Cytophagales bacterium]